jgi:prophage regulatory protein
MMRSPSKFIQHILEASSELRPLGVAGQPIDFFVGLKTVQAMTDLSPSRLWELEQVGLFPKRIKIGPARVAWSLQEIQSWQQERKDRRGTKL